MGIVEGDGDGGLSGRGRGRGCGRGRVRGRGRDGWGRKGRRGTRVDDRWGGSARPLASGGRAAHLCGPHFLKLPHHIREPILGMLEEVEQVALPRLRREA